MLPKIRLQYFVGPAGRCAAGGGTSGCGCMLDQTGGGGGGGGGGGCGGCFGGIDVFDCSGPPVGGASPVMTGGKKMCCGAYCFGGAYDCSECVGNASDNNTLCSSCITNDKGSCFYAGACASPEVPTPGSCTSLCVPPAAVTCGGPNSLASCFPLSCATTCQPPSPCCVNECCDTCDTCDTCKPRNKAGGAGSSGSSSGGGGSARPGGGSCNSLGKLLNSLANMGNTMATLMRGGTPQAPGTAHPGQAVAGTVAPAMTQNTFFLIILIVGALLLMMAFGKKGG